MQVMQGFDFRPLACRPGMSRAAQRTSNRNSHEYVTKRQAFSTTLSRALRACRFPAGRGRGQAARRTPALLRGPMVALIREAARMAGGGIAMVGTSFRGPGPSISACSCTAVSLQPRPAHRPRLATLSGSKSRRRRRADHEDARGPRGHRRGHRPYFDVGASSRSRTSRAPGEEAQPHVVGGAAPLLHGAAPAWRSR